MKKNYNNILKYLHAKGIAIETEITTYKGNKIKMYKITNMYLTIAQLLKNKFMFA